MCGPTLSAALSPFEERHDGDDDVRLVDADLGFVEALQHGHRPAHRLVHFDGRLRHQYLKSRNIDR